MTARLSEAELDRWFPIPFDDIGDPLATPEPARGALIQLDSGDYIVVYYGLDSHQLTVELPGKEEDFSGLMGAFFSEVPLPRSRILWHRSDIALPQQGRRAPRAKTPGKVKRPKRSARRATMPKRR